MSTLAPSRTTHHTALMLTLTAWASWASYLINGDASGLEPDEVSALRQWVQEEGLEGRLCVSCDGDTYLGSFMGMRGECLQYTFV